MHATHHPPPPHLAAVLGVFARVVDHEAEAAGRELVLVQPHDNALDVAHLGQRWWCGGPGGVGGGSRQGVRAGPPYRRLLDAVRGAHSSCWHRVRAQACPTENASTRIPPRPAAPTFEKTSKIWSSVVKKDRLPTYTVVDECRHSSNSACPPTKRRSLYWLIAGSSCLSSAAMLGRLGCCSRRAAPGAAVQKLGCRVRAMGSRQAAAAGISKQQRRQATAGGGGGRRRPRQRRRQGAARFCRVPRAQLTSQGRCGAAKAHQRPAAGARASMAEPIGNRGLLSGDAKKKNGVDGLQA